MRKGSGKFPGMKMGWPALAAVFLAIAFPNPVRAETHVYVSFSVGGAFVIGAGVVFWSFSYASQVSETKSPEERPDRLLRTTASDLPSRSGIESGLNRVPKSLTTDDRTRADSIFLPDGPREAPSLEVPLFTFRW